MKSYFAFRLLASLLVVAVASLVSADMASYLKRTTKKLFDKYKTENPNTIELKNGMLVKWIKKGSGDKCPFESTSCKMHYHGSLLRGGDVFNSSIERGSPIDFAPNQVINSWKFIMTNGMCEGDEIEIVSPSDLAYGTRGSPPKIPGNSALVFKMQMLKVNGDSRSPAEARKLLQEATV